MASTSVSDSTTTASIGRSEPDGLSFHDLKKEASRASSGSERLLKLVSNRTNSGSTCSLKYLNRPVTSVLPVVRITLPFRFPYRTTSLRVLIYQQSKRNYQDFQIQTSINRGRIPLHIVRQYAWQPQYETCANHLRLALT